MFAKGRFADAGGPGDGDVGEGTDWHDGGVCMQSDAGVVRGGGRCDSET